jgi:hypothetical protein
MEDVVGEYILNISKENIKIAALRGKIKLENVQLDGDLIGSHILGAVGLSGFGVLSCWARTIKAVVPLKNLEKEPTRIEMHGLHLVCVPLLPSTANRVYGSATDVDPRCTLRTRAKRSALARFERNYFAGRVPGEGPPSRRLRRAIIEAEHVLKKGKGRWKGSFTSRDEDALDKDIPGGHLVPDFDDDSINSDSDNTVPQVGDIPAALRIPIVANNWKTKMREKMLRNLECKAEDIHIRCEVSEQGLDFYQPEDQRQKPSSGIPAEQRAFSFGVTIDSMYVRTANDKWEVGSETAKSSDESSSSRSKRDDSSSSSYSATTATSQSAGGMKNKVFEINNASIYWDDDPPLLISETFLLRSNEHTLSPMRLQSRIDLAMDAMKLNQDPGEAVRQSLSARGGGTPSRSEIKPSKVPSHPHHYILEAFSWVAQVKMGDRNNPGPMTLIAEFLPVEANLYFRPHQYLQYTMLRSAMLSQQRFDTMLRQRPTEEPRENPLAWWAYAISCVTTRPNSRPWVDVVQIVRSRKRYIELVIKKVMHSSKGNGFHGGLDEIESLELLALEELLPIEALMSFHLLALRKVYESQIENEADEELTKLKRGRQSLTSPEKLQSKPRFRRLRRALSGVGSKSKQNGESDDSETDLLPSVSLPGVQPSDSISRSSLKEAISARLGKKIWHNTFFLKHVNLKIHLLDTSDDAATLLMDLRISGRLRTFGIAKFDLGIDVMRFEVVDCRHDISSTPSQFFADGKILSVGQSRGTHLFSSHFSPGDPLSVKLMPRSQTVAIPEADQGGGSSHGGNPETKDLSPPNYTDLPNGVVCRVVSSRDIGALKLTVAAHPATLVWHKSSIDAVTEFFASSTSQLQTELTRQLQTVATPLARKAQLALLSPDAITVDVNMAAPKIWLPVSSESNDAVFLDAGRFKVACSKKEQGIDTHWEVIACDIQVMFVRLRRTASRASKSGAGTRDFSVTGIPDSEELPIIRPFHIQLNDSLSDEGNHLRPSTKEVIAPDDSLVGNGPTRKTTVTVSPIRLNLVDAEVLARAIGKWYAQGIGRVKGRATAEGSDLHKSMSKRSSQLSPRQLKEASSGDSNIALGESSHAASSSHSLLVKVEKIEMAIEGHSKSSVQIPDDQSVASHASLDTFLDPTPRKRTYIVEVFDIVVDRTKRSSKARTTLTVMDASIARVKDNVYPFPSFVPQESQYLILVRGDGRKPTVSMAQEEPLSLFQPIPESFQQATDAFDTASPFGISATSPSGRLDVSPGNFPFTPEHPKNQEEAATYLLSATLFHDTVQHLDEVEIDVDSVTIRVTPTSLKDSAKGLHRFLELVELTTKEMERKVHEEGRNARRMGQGKEAIVDYVSLIYNESQSRYSSSADQKSDPLRSSSSLGRPISPSDVGTEVTNTGEAMPEKLIDSSILFKVTLRDSTMLIGRPVMASSRGPFVMDMSAQKRDAERSNAVVQILSKSLIMFQSIENPDGSGSKTLHTSLDNFSIALNTEFEPVSLSEVSPAIGPTASEIRVVYSTENLGCVVSQDISLDCESAKAYLAPEDIRILSTICRYVFDRLRTFGAQSWSRGNMNDSDRRPIASSIIRYQKKGTGIATRLRLEIQLLSFVLLRTYRPSIGVIPIFDVNVKALKGNVEGCMSALTGEIAALVSTDFFNTELGDWEYAIEPFEMTLAIDQMPNELVSF